MKNELKQKIIGLKDEYERQLDRISASVQIGSNSVKYTSKDKRVKLYLQIIKDLEELLK